MKFTFVLTVVLVVVFLVTLIGLASPEVALFFCLLFVYYFGVDLAKYIVVPAIGRLVVVLRAPKNCLL